MTTVIFPDAAAAFCSYLVATISASPLAFAANVDVATSLKNPRPTYAVTVRCDGGPPAETVFSDLRFGINVWAPTRDEAVDLANVVTALVNSMAESHATPFVDSTATVANEVPEQAEAAHMYLTATARLRGTDLA